MRVADERKELTAREIDEIARTCPPFMRLSLSGGEPFLRPDLVDICYSFYKHCNVLFITIPSNGSLPDKIKSDLTKLAQQCPEAIINISLSLNGLGTARDASVGRPDTMNALIKTAEVVRSLKLQYPHIQLTAITTNLRANQDTLPDIYKFALETLKVDNFTFNIARIDNNVSVQPIAGSLESYKKMTAFVKNDWRSSRFSFLFSSLFTAKRNLVFDAVIKTSEQNKWHMPCYSGYLRCVMDEVGNVFPCETHQYSPSQGSFSFGNLRDHKLNMKALLDSPQAIAVKRRVKKMKCFCINECDVETNILFNKRFAGALIIEAMKCVFGKKTPGSRG
jgi:MoaA/NifB/PqqE/SkfB family radical SAM enzyme